MNLFKLLLISSSILSIPFLLLKLVLWICKKDDKANTNLFQRQYTKSKFIIRKAH
jgi:hypothetical protein